MRAKTKDNKWYEVYADRGEVVELVIDKHFVRVEKKANILEWDNEQAPRKR